MRSGYTSFGFADAELILRMSPWCTVASWPFFQAIVTASHHLPLIVPLSAASPRQNTRSPSLRLFDSAGVTLRLHHFP
jgi:hypothetical protein